MIIDTPPDYLKRPYATHTLMSGGTVVLPCPPGARERMGVGHMLEHFRDAAPERLNRSALLFMEPEKGVVTSIKTIIPLFGTRYPDVRALGTLPRAPRLVMKRTGEPAGLVFRPHGISIVTAGEI